MEQGAEPIVTGGRDSRGPRMMVALWPGVALQHALEGFHGGADAEAHCESTAKAFMRSRVRPAAWAWSSMALTEAGPVREVSVSWASNSLGAPAPASTNSNLGSGRSKWSAQGQQG